MDKKIDVESFEVVFKRVVKRLCLEIDPPAYPTYIGDKIELEYFLENMLQRCLIRMMVEIKMNCCESEDFFDVEIDVIEPKNIWNMIKSYVLSDSIKKIIPIKLKKVKHFKKLNIDNFLKNNPDSIKNCIKFKVKSMEF